MEGQTLILPAHKLSARDKEILAGIGPWSYRTYPVRAGETLDVSPGSSPSPTAPRRPNDRQLVVKALQHGACRCGHYAWML